MNPVVEDKRFGGVPIEVAEDVCACLDETLAFIKCGIR